MITTNDLHKIAGIADTQDIVPGSYIFCHDRAPYMAKALLAIGKLVRTRLYSEAWIEEHIKDDHMCGLDHKDEIEYAELIRDLRAILDKLESSDAE